jgi:ATP-binding protein involved in chromosome partitioning
MDEEWLPFAQEFKKMVETIEDLSVAGTPPNLEKGDREEKKGEVVKKDNILIAIPTAGGKLCSHFGHCEQFALIQTENGQIKGKTMQTPPPHEPGILPKWLHDKGAGLIIAGGMGAKAKELFTQNGIRVITGAPMDSPESLVNQYLSETLVTGDNSCDH